MLKIKQKEFLSKKFLKKNVKILTIKKNKLIEIYKLIPVDVKLQCPLKLLSIKIFSKI